MEAEQKKKFKQAFAIIAEEYDYCPDDLGLPIPDNICCECVGCAECARRSCDKFFEDNNL